MEPRVNGQMHGRSARNQSPVAQQAAERLDIAGLSDVAAETAIITNSTRFTEKCIWGGPYLDKVFRSVCRLCLPVARDNREQRALDLISPRWGSGFRYSGDRAAQFRGIRGTRRRANASGLFNRRPPVINATARCRIARRDGYGR
jgi:hypothetical protein